MKIDGIKERAKIIVPEFVINDPIKVVIKAFSYYFNNDPEFEKMKPGWKLNKGICLWGNVGVGKTTLMNTLMDNPRIPFDMINCRVIVGNYLRDGYESIDIYRRNNTYTYLDENQCRLTTKFKGICFDDFGVERDAVSYGDRVNLLEEIILDRYDNHIPFDQTHLTTNLTSDEIEKRYGTRVRSRMREMFNLIELHGSDFRK